VTTFSDFETLWENASDMEKRAIKGFVTGYSFGRGPGLGESRAHTLPEDFKVTDGMREWAARVVPKLNISVHTPKFRDHWAANAEGKYGKKCDWTAAWRSWMRKAGNL